MAQSDLQNRIGISANKSPETTDAKKRLSVVSGILRLGHEAFDKKGLDAVATHVVNNSRLIVSYERCCIVDMRSGKPRILSITGQSEVKGNSEYCLNIRRLLRPFPTLVAPLELSEELLNERKAHEDTLAAFRYFQQSVVGKRIYLFPFPRPGPESPDRELFIWVLEYSEQMNKGEQNVLALLSRHYGEALWYNVRPTNAFHKYVLARGRITPLKVLGFLGIMFFVSLFLVHFPQSVVADFELIPTRKSVHCAPFNGIIREAKFENGEEVEQGDSIIEYDTEELLFELSKARNLSERISAELDLVRQASFSKPEELGNVKLIELKEKINKVSIEKLTWYLSKSRIRAAQKGILVIDDKENLGGKAVSAGDKLFEVVSPDNLSARVMLHETNAAVLRDMRSVTLYLHSRPEMPFHGEIVSVSPRPILTDKRRFCYIIELELTENNPAFVCGMRGVARVKGRRISFGYYLFRNLILWWRRV